MSRSSVRLTTLAYFLLAASISAAAQSNTPAQPAAAPAETPVDAKAAVSPPAWVVRSNQYTQMVLDVQSKHQPESGSAEGLTQYDSQISDASRAEEIAQRKDLEAVLAKLKKAAATEKDLNVRQDLEIIQKNFALQFRLNDYQLNHKVPYINATATIFSGLRELLDDKIVAERRPAAVIRLRKYAGVEPGYKPLTAVLKQRIEEQMAKPDVVYPSSIEIESQLGRNKAYVDNIAALFRKYNVTGWEEPYAKLNQELSEYDSWVRATLIPHGRPDFRLQPEEYAISLQGFGIETPPADLAAMAHAAFSECQAQMAPLAAQIAKAHGWTSTDYRDVIRQLKKEQIAGDAILPLYRQRLKAIEDIIVARHLVTLPDRPGIVRLGNAVETAQLPAPHEVTPSFQQGSDEKVELVLPLNKPLSGGRGDSSRYDDFTFDAVAWSLTAHEARPGHELQFDSMLEHGNSLARLLYAFNSTDIEGWGLYAEQLIYPYEPPEGQLITLQFRLLRDARVFLDYEMQTGKTTQDQATNLLEGDVVVSRAYSHEEVQRFVLRPPGQSNGYFYGYTQLMQLRKDTEAALGAKFNPQKFHDFVLAQGLLPPDLVRKAVMGIFVPSQKK